MIHVSAKLIPKVLTDQQKNLRVEVAQDYLEIVNNDESVLKRL